jgi:hypothetical protein
VAYALGQVVLLTVGVWLCRQWRPDCREMVLGKPISYSPLPEDHRSPVLGAPSWIVVGTPPEWGFGLTEPAVLLEFRREQAQQKPAWCRHPDTLLEQLVLAIADGGSNLGSGCSARLEDSAANGRILGITCPFGEIVRTCVNTYRGTVWGNRYDDAPANYALYGFGWVRRACRSAEGDFGAPFEVWEAAARSSKALKQFLDQCR